MSKVPKLRLMFFLFACSISIYYLFILFYPSFNSHYYYDTDFDTDNRYAVIKYKEFIFHNAMLNEKGMGCDYPKINPYHEELTQFDKFYGKIVCNNFDWVVCNLDKCIIKPEVFTKYSNVSCEFTWILFENDFKFTEEKDPNILTEDAQFDLTASDHAKVECKGENIDREVVEKWKGYVTGFRSNVTINPAPPERNNTPNIMILVFDSTSMTGFIRKMNMSYQVLKNKLNAVIMQGYNVAGDGTAANMFPFFTGHNDLELPDSRSYKPHKLDKFPFIFFKLRQDGYRTGYFEETPQLGTFQYRHNGFKYQPTHHYLRPLCNQERKDREERKIKNYCFGDRPQFLMLLNLTEQFHSLGGKLFSFTFISDIAHDDNNYITSSDEDVSKFLERMSQYLNNTMLIVMGDHGPRYEYARNNLYGKYDERHPFMAIVLPHRYVAKRRKFLKSLKQNENVLTTPYDMHATLLHVVGLSKYRNPYKVPGASLRRGLSLLNVIPKNRSCSEAGIEPHWCPCVKWTKVNSSHPQYETIVKLFVIHVNNATSKFRDICAERKLLQIDYVQKQYFNEPFLKFKSTLNNWIGKFKSDTKVPFDTFQIKVILTPKAIFEATITYLHSRKRFRIDPRDVSRLDWYAKEAWCMNNPYLAKYCYCK